MALICWLVLLLVPSTTLAQSGDSDDDEPSLTCSSDISKHLNRLTCLLGEEDKLEALTLCNFRKPQSPKNICLEKSGAGKNFTFSDLEMLAVYNLTYRLKGGSVTTQQIELKKIVKPRTPRVVSTTYHPRSDRLQIQIGTPYEQDYLSNKLLFQLEIWTANSPPLTPTIKYQEYTIGGEYFKKNTLYHVRVRAKPDGYFRGFWSEWSPSVSFSTYREDLEWYQPVLVYSLSLALVVLLLITITAVFLWRKRIKSFIWPSIPHPKHTCAQLHLYHQSKHPPVSFNPEMFSDLSTWLVLKVEGQQGSLDPSSVDAFLKTQDRGNHFPRLPELSADTSSGIGASELSSAASNKCSEAGTKAQSVGLLELGSGPDTTQPDTDAGDAVPKTVEVNERGKEEAYVTMSSFYQVKLQDDTSKKVEI